MLALMLHLMDGTDTLYFVLSRSIIELKAVAFVLLQNVYRSSSTGDRIIQPPPYAEGTQSTAKSIYTLDLSGSSVGEHLDSTISSNL